MRIPAPQKLPSGKWYIQVMVNGKRRSQSFDSKEDALYWASGIKTKSIEDAKSPRNLTVGEAIDRYIESKSAVLSPSTILGYKKIKRCRMNEILNVRIQDLTQEKIQRWINNLAKKSSPKTVSDTHGFLSAVINTYNPSMVLRTTLPQRVKKEIQIPTEAELKTIIAASRGTKYELPIMLAIWLGLRESEILGLTWDCIEGDYIHIRQAIIMGEDGPVLKGTKTYSGTRKISLPAYLKNLIEAQPHKEDHIVTMSAKSIYSGFVRICKKAGLPHFRFHDLRHINASVMLALNIPNKYSMKRIGHSTDNMLKTVYQHTIKERELAYNQEINGYFENLIDPGE